MNIEQAYNKWASQYDTNQNKTRDLEGIAIRECLQDIPFNTCLEIGCGTGKNTEWLVQKAAVTAVDFSDEMLQKAKEKITSDRVTFLQADITKAWNFTNIKYDLISFSLVLEHIENLHHVFNEAAAALNISGHIYMGELHPFKQYAGSRARFSTDDGTQIVTCFNHHISDFTQAAKKHGLIPIDINEYFDDNISNELPRILTIVFKKF